MERGNLEDVGVFLAQELYEITAEDLHGMSLSERTKGIFYITIFLRRVNTFIKQLEISLVMLRSLRVTKQISAKVSRILLLNRNL